jgi:hypothetical protein
MKETHFGSSSIREGMKAFLYAESSIANGVCHTELVDRAEKIKALIGSSCQTASAIGKLSDDVQYFLAECTMLARSFIEKVINFCYLIVCDQDEFDRFIKYSVQKSFRKLERSITVGDTKLGFKFMGDVDITSNKLLEEGLRDFTSEKGREKTRWTNVDLSERLKIINERAKISPAAFMMNLLTVYEDASEALHGTLYGCSFHTGAWEPGIDSGNPQDVRENIEKKATLLLLGLGTMFHLMIILLSRENQNFEEIVEKSTANYETAYQLLEKAMNKK